ncbi:MAG: hypothetical protein QM751_01130 [Paludibacteraceae bacterium]
MITAYYNYTLGNISNVTSNLTLAATIGSNITIAWTSSRPEIISTTGVVVPLQKYNAIVKLTATMSEVVEGVTYTLTKEFYATVMPLSGEMPEEIAQWDFNGSSIGWDEVGINVTDTKSGFIGVLKNDARVRTIGTPETEQFVVLDLGNGTGYFDMGTQIGEAMYALTDYTISGFFRVADTYDVASAGNFMYTFSNGNNMPTDNNGYIIGILNNQSNKITTGNYNQEQGVAVGTAAEKGFWHHLTYVQHGNVGTIYIDGVEKATSTVTNLPGKSLPIAGRTGTLYNWLGRSCYPSDAYLRNTLLYDFRVFSVALSPTDINIDILQEESLRERLNNAYVNNSDYIDTELITERDNLTIENLNAVTSNLTLPNEGKLYPTIAISWKSSNESLIDSKGVVTRPDYYSSIDTLTATLFRNGQSVTKKFYATVLPKTGTEFANDLLVRYDFSQVSKDTVVTDIAEKQFSGIVKSDAKVHSIGLTKKFNILHLGETTGYFDMGEEIGKLMYNLTDFTLSAYYRVDDTYEELTNSINGNFLWSFSNVTNILADAKGYLIYSLKNNAATISSGNWNDEQTVKTDQTGLKGSWHNVTYTQSGTTGTIYIDGTALATALITQLPKNTLPKEGRLGTLYNWIGRSCYDGDVYLRKSMVYDFRLYRVALTPEQIESTVLNVGNTINELNVAYSEDPTSVPSVNQSSYKITSSKGLINILGLNGTETVSVFDISGNQMKVSDNASINVNAGIYIVRINNYASKVIVR